MESRTWRCRRKYGIHAGIECVLEIAKDQPADPLRLPVVCIVKSLRQYVGAYHDAALNLGSEALCPGPFVHLYDPVAFLRLRAKSVADAVVSRQVRRSFRGGDHVVCRKRILRVRKRNIDDARARALQHIGALGPDRLNLIRHSVNPVLARNSNRLSLYATAKERLEIRHRDFGRRRVFRVLARHRFKHDGCVSNGFRQGTCLIKRRGERDNAPSRAAPVGWLQSDDSRECGRLPY